MRTTLNLDDDVLGAVKAFAAGRSLALGKAVSVLVRRGLTVRCPTRKVNGLLVFDPPANSTPITAAHVRRIEDEL